MTWKQVLNDLAENRGFKSWDEMTDGYEAKNWAFRYGAVLSIAAETYAQIRIQESKVEALPPQQRRMYDVLDNDWTLTKDVCIKSETTSGKVDALLKALVRKGLVEVKKHGPKLQYWKRKEVGI